MVNKVYSNRISEYAHENGGRVIVLFLLFLLSLYSFKNSGVNGMAMILAIPVSIVLIYSAFSYRMFSFWTLFIINYFVMFLSKEGKMPLPASLPNELLELVLIAIAIIDLKETKFENCANLMLVAVLGWCTFCIIEILNDTCGLGINVNAWFTGVRLMAFQLLYPVIVFTLYINTPQRLHQIYKAWAFCALFAVFWCWKQINIGWDAAEMNWLFAQDHARQHIVNGIVRYFGTFSDAANFGIHMACASVSFFIIAITNKVKKHKIFFGIVGTLTTWAMFQSGTRTAIFCMMAGFMVFLVLSKSTKIIVPVSIVFGLFIGMLMFTNIGQGNNQIRRMRSAFNPEDASANVRDINKAAIAKYMKDAPWGIGIGIFERDIPAWNKFKIVSQIPPDSEYVFIWVRTGWIGVSWFAICNLIILLGACSVVFFKIRNRSLMGMGAAWCASFAALHLGGYANQILMQFPNIVVFYGGLSTVFLMPSIEKEFEAYEAKELAEEEEKKRIKLEKKRAKRV
jgi:hypothetical protein